MLTAEAIEWLEGRGIDAEVATSLGLFSSDRLGSSTISIPYYKSGEIVNHKHRDIRDKRFSQDGNAEKIVWNYDALTDESLSSEPLIICEGEFDAIACIQAGFGRVISVPDGAPKEELGEAGLTKYSYLNGILPLLKDDKQIVLATDMDGPGEALAADLALRLGRSRCQRARYPFKGKEDPQRCKDLNEVLLAYGAEGVRASIQRAKWVNVSGLVKMSDLPPVHQPAPYSTGIDGLDENYKVRRGDFTVVTGKPGVGKTTLLNNIACNMIDRHNWRICFASFEQNPRMDHERNLIQWQKQRPFHALDDVEIAHSRKWIDEHFMFIYPDEDEDVPLDWLLERMSAAVVRHGCDMVIIDPWNELDHQRPSDMTMTEYVGQAIRLLKKFAKKHAVALIVVAHPAKLQRSKDGKEVKKPSLYDISDSAHFFNKPDAGLVVFDHKEESGDILYCVEVAKSRYWDQIGRPGMKFYRLDPVSKRMRQEMIEGLVGV